MTLGGDRGFDTADFVGLYGNLRVTPHVAQNPGHRGVSAVDRPTTCQPGYRFSQKKLKVDCIFPFARAAYNLVHIRNLLAPPIAAQ